MSDRLKEIVSRKLPQKLAQMRIERKLARQREPALLTISAPDPETYYGEGIKRHPFAGRSSYRYRVQQRGKTTSTGVFTYTPPTYSSPRAYIRDETRTYTQRARRSSLGHKIARKTGEKVMEGSIDVKSLRTPVGGKVKYSEQHRATKGKHFSKSIVKRLLAQAKIRFPEADILHANRTTGARAGRESQMFRLPTLTAAKRILKRSKVGRVAKLAINLLD